MENAADALKMAAAVLVFVLALSISINTFSEVRKTSQIILDYNDREYNYTYVEDNGDTKRKVGAETIIPSIYRAYQENYKIVFNDLTLFEMKTTEGDKSINYIDLQENNFGLGSEEQKRKFIQAILYGTSSFDDKASIVKEFSNLGINFVNEEGIFKTIKNSKYEESLGVYYQEEVDSDATRETPEANKTKKRVITYSKI